MKLFKWYIHHNGEICEKENNVPNRESMNSFERSANKKINTINEQVNKFIYLLIYNCRLPIEECKLQKIWWINEQIYNSCFWRCWNYNTGCKQKIKAYKKMQQLVISKRLSLSLKFNICT